MILGANDLTAATVTEVVELTQERKIEQVAFCNRTSSSMDLRLWFVPTDTAQSDTYAWLFDRSIPANSSLLVLEHDFTMRTGETIHAYASAANCSVSVIGR